MLNFVNSTRNYGRIGLIGLMSSVSLSPYSVGLDIQENHTDDKKKAIASTNYGIPTNLKTGSNILQESIPTTLSHTSSYHSVGDELAARYDELLDNTIFKLDTTPISEFDRRTLTPDITKHIPASIITSQAFNPSDSLFNTAIKLERLALIIKDLSFPVISERAYNLRQVLMSQCFVKAGCYMEQAAKNLVEKATNHVNLIVLNDMYRSSGQFFHWAAINMPKALGDIFEQRANRLFEKMTDQTFE